MFTTLIRALLGAFGIIRKDIAFKKTDVNEFMRALEPATVILTRKRNPNFLQGGIMGATNSAWQHALLYFGQSSGMKGLLHEIVEAQGEGVIISQLDKNFGDDNQMVGFTFPLDAKEFLLVKLRAYSMVGRPYDVAEFLRHIIPIIPNPSDLVVCSTECTYSYEPTRFKLVKNNVRADEATPGDIWNGCYRQVDVCKVTRYNF